MFQTRHYKAVAATIRATHSIGQFDTWRDLVENFVQMFKEDNPNFSPEKFRTACGLMRKD